MFNYHARPSSRHANFTINFLNLRNDNGDCGTAQFISTAVIASFIGFTGETIEPLGRRKMTLVKMLTRPL